MHCLERKGNLMTKTTKVKTTTAQTLGEWH